MQSARLIFSLVGVLFFQVSFAQSEKELIRDGNKSYAEKNYEQASAAYNKAITLNPQSLNGHGNLGNSQFKEKKFEDALKSYDKALELEKDQDKISNLHYNKGVVYQTETKIEDCIEQYKKALRIDPNDDDARQNLQKALKKQQEDKKDNKNDKNKDKNDKPDKQDEKPQPSKSNLSQKEAEDKLKALMQQEKNLQNKLHKSNGQSAASPEKDW